MDKIIKDFEQSPVIAVLTLNNKKQALKVADALVSEGLTNLEITLRTQNALDCIEIIGKKFPQANVGAGTVIKKEQLQQIKNAGASFAVSPGFTKTLVKEAKKIDMPYLPGASTPSEIIALYELGVKFQKFFHAKNLGGYKILKAYSTVFPDIKFCPTGGISQDDFKDYLKLNNVICLGGSWMVDTKDINFENIKKAAHMIMNNLKKL